jgi:hypothetical protein
MPILSSIKQGPERCGEYWRLWDRMMAVGRELEDALAKHSEQVGQIKLDMDVVAREISQHVACCEKCQTWWRMFEFKK